jgi:hypothetical protein
MRKAYFLASALAAFATPAYAATAHAKPGDPVPFGDGMTFDPIIDLRLRYEDVDLDSPDRDAEALTARLRAGFEVRHESGFALLAEGEGTLAIANDYNAFPFAVASHQRRTRYAVVPDPENIELNRLQVQWKGKAGALTVGRQRINLDDQRWVGSVGWRQNEQTFDAVRGEAKLGPTTLDGTNAISQRAIWGIDAGPRQAMHGDFALLNAGVKLGPVNLKGFAYLIDYDSDEEAYFLSNASQTYGARATASFPLGKAKLGLAASYARQSDFGDNPFDYAADYLAAEAALGYKGLTATAGYELLGSDATSTGGRFAVQTPLATLHKFNGWADVFLVTPAAGLQDRYAGLAYKFDGIKALPGLNAAVTYHDFDSDRGGIDYGHEWDAALGVKLGPVALLAKYARYERSGAANFASDVDTRKLWLQAEVSY